MRCGSRWVWIDARVRIHVEQRAKLRQVARRLQQPALAARALLEGLQEAAVVAVGGPQVGAQQVAVIARHRVAAAPVVGEERVERDEDALVREVARIRVHRLVLGLEVVPEAGLGVADVAQRVARQRLDGVRHLPHARRAAGGVAGQQLVQDRGARARAADHEDRLRDRLAQDLGPALPQLGELEPVAERAQQLTAHDDAPGEVQLRLGLEGAGQHAVGNLPVALAEVLEARRAPRGREELVGVEADEPGGAAHRVAVGVQALDPARARRRAPGHYR